MKTILYCLLIAYLSIWASCTKNLDCRGTIHYFEAFYKAYPDEDSIRVNDTIWIEMSTSTQLKDLTSGQMIDYSGAANFGTVISFVELTGGDLLNPGAIPAANDFDNVLINGSAVQTDRLEELRGFLFEEQNDMYLFKVGIVPKRKGFFLINAEDASNVVQKSDNCRKSNFKLTFIDTDQHLYLYEQRRPGYALSDYERGHLCALKVY